MSVKDKQQIYRNFIVRSFIVFLSVSVGISCSPINQKMLQELNKNVQDNQKMSDEYEKYLKQGEEFSANKEFQQAEHSFREALKIAENKDWVNEIVSVKTKIANVYMFEKNFQKSEAMFNEAISTCESNNKCSSEQLDVTLGFLSFLYLYQMQDASKAQILVDKIRSSKVFANAGQTKDKTCRYIEKIKSAGYKEKAIELAKQETCNQ